MNPHISSGVISVALSIVKTLINTQLLSVDYLGGFLFHEVLQCITHSVHEVVKIIYRLVKPLACLAVNRPCVVINLGEKIHAPRMYDNAIIADKVDAVPNTVPALSCRSYA